MYSSLLVSVAEMANRLHISRQAVWALVKRKTISPPIKVMARYVWSESVAEEIIYQRIELDQARLRLMEKRHKARDKRIVRLRSKISDLLILNMTVRKTKESKNNS